MKRLGLVVALLLAISTMGACKSSSSTNTGGSTTTAEERSSRGSTDGTTDGTADGTTGGTAETTTSESTTTSTSGGGGISADEQAYVDAMLSTLSGDDELTPDQAHCVATAMVRGIGVDTLRQNGVTPESIRDEGAGWEPPFPLSQQQARAIAAGFAGCVDLRALIVGEIAGPDLTADQRACLERELPVDALIDLMALGLMAGDDAEPGPEAFAPLLAAYERCGLGADI